MLAHSTNLYMALSQTLRSAREVLERDKLNPSSQAVVMLRVTSIAYACASFPDIPGNPDTFRVSVQCRCQQNASYLYSHPQT